MSQNLALGDFAAFDVSTPPTVALVLLENCGLCTHEEWWYYFVVTLYMQNFESYICADKAWIQLGYPGLVLYWSRYAVVNLLIIGG